VNCLTSFILSPDCIYSPELVNSHFLHQFDQYPWMSCCPFPCWFRMIHQAFSQAIQARIASFEVAIFVNSK
jgi:hypothetical protein